LTWFHPHAKRGTEAMDEIGILPLFQGVLCHDNWKPYYRYTHIIHALCNATPSENWRGPGSKIISKWARQMQAPLIDIVKAVEEAGGRLAPNAIE